MADLFQKTRVLGIELMFSNFSRYTRHNNDTRFYIALKSKINMKDRKFESTSTAQLK